MSIFKEVQKLRDEAQTIIDTQIRQWADAFEKQGMPKDVAMELAKKLHEEIEKKIVVKP